jgi:RNA polymerase sigma factor (sigma-70 family)
MPSDERNEVRLHRELLERISDPEAFEQLRERLGQKVYVLMRSFSRTDEIAVRLTEYVFQSIPAWLVSRPIDFDLDNVEDWVCGGALSEIACFDEIYARYRVPIVVFIDTLVRNYATAEETADDSFIRFLRVLQEGGFNPRLGTIQALLYCIARKQALDHLRKEGRRKRLFNIFASQPHPFMDQIALGAMEMLDALETDQDRAIASMRMAGLQLEEIALATEQSVSSVNRRLAVIRRILESFNGRQPFPNF